MPARIARMAFHAGPCAAFKTQSGDILYTVHIRMEEDDPLLRWGMTVEVTFTNPK